MRNRFFSIVIICLLLSGCGRESSEGPPVREDVVLQEMPLIQSEDPENENLAGLLQENGGGMMVQIGAGSQLGSGVIYGTEEGKLLVLTAAHVLEAAGDSVRVTFADGLSVVCGDFISFASADVGLIRVDGADIPEERLEHYCRAAVEKESFDAVKPGDGCIVMGSRTDVAAEAYEGTLLDSWIYMEDYEQYMMWVKAEGKAGMSGGGLFDSQGHFLGILSGVNGEGELAVVPLSLIRAALDACNS